MKRLAQLLLCGVVSVASSEAANIGFVSFHADDNTPSTAAAAAGFTQAPDAGYTELLRNNGHTVTRIVTSATPDANVLNAFDVVLISRSVPSGNYQQAASTAAWNGLTAPTIILGGYILRNSRLGYTTGGTMVDTTVPVGLKVNVPGHPIFSGISLDGNGKMVNAFANIVSYTNAVQRGVSINNNPVSGGGVVLASVGTIGDPTLGGMVIGEWMAGDKMATAAADTLAGHRLVLLTGSRELGITAEAAGIYDLTADGAQILLNAVNYMTSGRASIATVNTVNNETPGVGETSLAQALSNLQDGDTVRFQIPGAGPHVITTPLGGYPLITAHSINIDGYTQAGAVPNSNPILGGNNAQIKIVLDSTGADTGASDPADAGLNSRRSTRILHSGYGDSENGILAFLGSDNIRIRGLSFIARRSAGNTQDPAIYAVALVNQATNARVQGCVFGLAPGGSTQADLKPVAAAVAAFRYRTGGDVYSAGAIIGTDGDGVADRSEFNVMVGGRISMALELPGARIAGNYVNVFPNGLTFVDIDDNYQQWGDVLAAAGEDPSDVTIENYENGRVTLGTIIGTNGDGISDSDERNIFGHVVYDHHGEFYSSSANAVLAGNYFGVGVDGTTLAPNSSLVDANFVEFGGGSSQVRIGSNGDGVSDDIEGNLIVNVKGGRFYVGNSSTQIVSSRNKLVNCGVAAVPFANGDNGVDYATYYGTFMDVTGGVTPILKPIAGGVLNATIPAPSAGYPNTVLDLYLVDQAAIENNAFWPAPMVHPTTFLGSYTDNGAGDSNPNPNEFSIDVSGFGLTPSTYVAAAASYSSQAGNFNALNAVTSPMSNPTSETPVLVQRTISNAGFIETIELSWLSAPESFDPQLNNNVADANNWGPFPLTSSSYVGGRNVVTTVFDFFTDAVFYRLISK